MPEEVLHKTEDRVSREEFADALRSAAGEVESGSVRLSDGDGATDIELPENPWFEVELERLTDSETGEERYELEYEIRWT